jgi:hypothetical protein
MTALKASNVPSCSLIVATTLLQTDLSAGASCGPRLTLADALHNLHGSVDEHKSILWLKFRNWDRLSQFRDSGSGADADSDGITFQCFACEEGSANDMIGR